MWEWPRWKRFIQHYIREQEQAMILSIAPAAVTKEFVEKNCRCVRQDKSRNLLCQESCPIHNSSIEFVHPLTKDAIDRVTAELKWNLRWWEQKKSA
jgi:hypothetical protein